MRKMMMGSQWSCGISRMRAKGCGMRRKLNARQRNGQHCYTSFVEWAAERQNETRGDCGESLLERWETGRWAKVGNEFRKAHRLRACATWNRNEFTRCAEFAEFVELGAEADPRREFCAGWSWVREFGGGVDFFGVARASTVKGAAAE